MWESLRQFKTVVSSHNFISSLYNTSWIYVMYKDFSFFIIFFSCKFTTWSWSRFCSLLFALCVGELARKPIDNIKNGARAYMHTHLHARRKLKLALKEFLRLDHVWKLRIYEQFSRWWTILLQKFYSSSPFLFPVFFKTQRTMRKKKREQKNTRRRRCLLENLLDDFKAITWKTYEIKELAERELNGWRQKIVRNRII